MADYGAGNLVSIRQAVERVGALATIVRDPRALDGADALVVPGVGAAAPAMARLERYGLAEAIRAWVGRGRPFLGICLGLQLLYEGSDEDGALTLGLLAGRTVALRDAPTLPHIGWNQVERRRRAPDSRRGPGRRRPVLRPLVRGRPRGSGRRSWPTPPTGRDSRASS